MTTTAPTVPTTDAGSARWQRRRVRLVAVSAAVAGAVAVWLIAQLGLGVDVRAPAFGPSQPSLPITAGQVLSTAALASLAGWGLLAMLERWTRKAAGTWLTIAILALLLSLGGPLSGTGVTATNRAVLVALHLVVGAVLIPLLYRSASTPPPLSSPRTEPADR